MGISNSWFLTMDATKSEKELRTKNKRRDHFSVSFPIKTSLSTSIFSASFQGKILTGSGTTSCIFTFRFSISIGMKLESINRAIFTFTEDVRVARRPPFNGKQLLRVVFPLNSIICINKQIYNNLKPTLD